MKGVFIDTETGGLDPRVHALTQIAAIAFNFEPGQTTEVIDITALNAEIARIA